MTCWWQVEQWMPGARRFVDGSGERFRGAWAFPYKTFRSKRRAIADLAKLERQGVKARLVECRVLP